MSVLKSKIISLSFTVFALSFVGLLLLANTAVGQNLPNAPGYGTTATPTTVTTLTGVMAIILGFARWMYIILLVITVIFILLAAFGYLTAGGDAEKLNAAKNRIIYAAVAVAVAVLAWGFTAIITSLISNPSGAL